MATPGSAVPAAPAAVAKAVNIPVIASGGVGNLEHLVEGVREGHASAVLAAKISGTENVASFVATITLASGLLFLALAIFRMGWIAQFLSKAVVTGFLAGAAVDVVIGELPKLTGTAIAIAISEVIRVP